MSRSIFDEETIRAIGKIAERLDVDPSALLAVAEVESGGKPFALVNGRREPLIRFEGHYFDRRLTERKRAQARALKLSSPTAGAIKNPLTQVDRWALLTRASHIDANAAFESVSWGLGQVMGAHWQMLGYTSVTQMVNTCRNSVAGQVEVMARYIEKTGLVDELQRLDFNAFARGYNGPQYRKYRYAENMAAAYRRLTGDAPVSAAKGMLRMGASGAGVRDLQALLARAGFPVRVDGDFGVTTKRAVTAFQNANRLTPDGVAGPQTLQALDEYRQAPEERPGKQALTDIPGVRQGVGGAVLGGGGLETASQAVQSASDQVSWVPGLEKLSAILSVLAVLLVLIGLSYAAWHWWFSSKTHEGDVAVDDDGGSMLPLFILVMLGGMALAGALATSAQAHDAKPTAAMPNGWKYPFSCCSGYDCREVTATTHDMFGMIRPGVVSEPTASNPSYVINRTGEQIAPGDTRLKDSPDGAFHWCSVAGANDSRTICLFVPPRSY